MVICIGKDKFFNMLNDFVPDYDWLKLFKVLEQIRLELYNPVDVSGSK